MLAIDRRSAVPRGRRALCALLGLPAACAATAPAGAVVGGFITAGATNRVVARRR